MRLRKGARFLVGFEKEGSTKSSASLAVSASTSYNLPTSVNLFLEMYVFVRACSVKKL